ncbi:hypothetical protein L1987_23882 [Smallanthus sonchifolius]|uniref:Uncharacterized protein n=1 Tax=Smallanthus sonchifolius TaxID=185202 RepID=A0ACB9IIV9_9ASTR|nr:hypothetical protein L1987_23882 [Smallanthus sonchifolius]
MARHTCADNNSKALRCGPLIHARNYVVMTGVNACISSVMKRLRGKEDVQTRASIKEGPADQEGAADFEEPVAVENKPEADLLLFSNSLLFMVAAFGSGVMFSLVSGMGSANHVANVITTGVFFALFQGGLFKVTKIFSQPSVKDEMYIETKAMLSSLGLENYEKNFKKGSLTDRTLPMLTDRHVLTLRKLK